MIGKILAEYRILEELGGQAGSRVYKAMGFDSRRPVAIKLFPSDLPNDQPQLQTLLDSLRRISRLDQPGIPRLIGSGLNGGRAYIIMPFMTGGSLQERLEMGQISPSHTLLLIEVIAGALETIHERSTVHGHLSPSEVMFDDTGQPQIIGLGHSPFVPDRWATTLDRDGGEYTAPEVRNGSPPTAASDQYSLAVLAFELLTGQRVHEALEAAALGASNGGASSDPRAELAPEVVEVLQRALEDEPSRRYGSVSELARALREATGMPPSVSRPPRLGRADSQTAHPIGRSLALGIVSLTFVALGCFALTLPALAARGIRLDLGSIADIFSVRQKAPTAGVEPDRSWSSLPDLPRSISTPTSFATPDLVVLTPAHGPGHDSRPMH